MAYDFLNDTHPVWERYHAEWERREILLRADDEVIGRELQRFEWEADDGDHYTARRRQAVYPGFGDSFLRTLIGHVLRDRPEADGALSFGRMGKIQRDEGVSEPSQAEQVFYNVNGVGGDGQQFWQWLSSVFQRAGATGLRWVMAESPRAERPPGSRDDELRGMRPYAVEFSPRAVTNWRFERGQLQWCVIRLREDTRRVVAGKMEGKADEELYYLLVRRGVADLGEQFAGGGWWRFDSDRNPAAGVNAGTWDKTGGEIPMALAVWEWESHPVDSHPLPLARSATTALDNLSVAYMNAKSAWRSNAWRSAGSPDFLLGVTSDSWQLAVEQIKAGHAWIGVPATQDTPTPTLAHGSAGLVSASAFQALLEDMTREAERMMIQIATSTPDSSGRSKEAGFAESKGPRLTMLAENIESFVNTLLRFFEMRFGHARPTAYVQMPREFDLAPVEQDIREFFDTLRRSELASPTVESDAIVRLAEAKGLVNDKNRDTVRAELLGSIEDRTVGAAQEDSFMASLFEGEPAAEPQVEVPQATQGSAPTGSAGIEVAAEKTLNGAQIQAALEVIARIKAENEYEQISQVAAIELLVAVGLERGRAEAMVASSVEKRDRRRQATTTDDTRTAEAA